MIILGINAYHGDASAAIFRDGQLLAAVEEERFSRVKHTAGFPVQAIRYCLAASGVQPEQIDHVAIPRKRSAHLAHKALWAIRLPHMAFARSKAWQKFGGLTETLAHCLGVPARKLNARFHFVEHHVSHASSSFYASPFQDAAVLSLDGLGDFASALWGVGKGSNLVFEDSVLFPHSLGLFYSAITQYLGFWKYGDEYKVMGLAAYGEPKYAEIFDRIVRQRQNGEFRLDLRYFTHHRSGMDTTWTSGEPTQSRLFSEELEQALGASRPSGSPIEKHHEDVAASLQWRLEEVVLALLNSLYEKTRTPNLCYAGGVAFNCVANGRIRDHTPFRNIYIQPAAGDAGLAVGAALYVHHQVLGNSNRSTMPHASWGPEYDEGVIKNHLESSGLRYREYSTSESLCEQAAELIAEGKVVGWFQGRAEWGPRALGNRSIVADSRRADMRDILNKRIKHRESFRPFSPSILEERTDEWFENDYPSPFMLMSYPVRPEKRAHIPSPTHVDGSGRLQTVNRSTSPLYWELIRAYEKLTGVPVLLNTSFNDNEPIVNTPEEALDCYTRTNMDALVIGPFVVRRTEQ